MNMKLLPLLLLVCFVLVLSFKGSFTLTAGIPYSGKVTKFNVKQHFVLLHGAGHGAWSWYKVTALLTSSGYNVTAVDLAASGISQVPVQQVNTFDDYAEPLLSLLTSLPVKERVILVGHSLAGAVISFVMERFPAKVAAAVYVNALMPGPGLSYLKIYGKLWGREFNASFDYPTTSLLIGPMILASRFYQLSPPEDLQLAMSLVRPTPVLFKDFELTNDKYGSVPRVCIVSDQDLSVPVEFQMWMISRTPPKEFKFINGSDHMVMISKPLELFSKLLSVAEKYP